MKNLKTMIIFICLLFSSIYSLEEVKQLSQCGNGKATFYEITGEGNCGFGDISRTVDTAAAEELIYDGSNGCGICYEVTGELGT